jgi:hypothetical protein
MPVALDISNESRHEEGESDLNPLNDYSVLTIH